MSVKSSFSIKELENLSGVKAHTIRIWEKRYELLCPERTDTNIRTYDLESLKKLMNVALLNNEGVKISNIVKLDDAEIHQMVRDLSLKSSGEYFFINALKLAMFNFDEKAFNEIYNQLLAQYSFRETFAKVMLPFLEVIGLLWMTKAIIPAHEHFITSLIKQKLLINIDKVQTVGSTKSETFILFLPVNELHELGLLYIHFELSLKGYKSIYLGPNVPIEDLVKVKGVIEKCSYVSYFTIEPKEDQVEKYIKEIEETVLDNEEGSLYFLGRNTRSLTIDPGNKKLRLFENIFSLLESV